MPFGRAQNKAAERAKTARITETAELLSSGQQRFGDVYLSVHEQCVQMALASGINRYSGDLPAEVALLVAKVAYEWCEALRGAMGLSTSAEPGQAGHGTLGRLLDPPPQQLRLSLSEPAQIPLWDQGAGWEGV